MAVRLRLRVDTPLLSLNLRAEQSAIRAPVTERNLYFVASLQTAYGNSHVVGFVSLDAVGSARKLGPRPIFISRSASLQTASASRIVVGFVSL